VNSEYIKLCIAQYFRYNRQCKLITLERSVPRLGWYCPDILIVNKDRKIIEVEVKISLADFKADAKKRIWKTRDTGKVKMPHQFYYGIPAELEEKIKPIMRKDCGLIRIGDKKEWQHYGGAVSVAKTAPVNKESKRLTARELVEMVNHQTGTLCSALKRNYEIQKKSSN